MRNYIARSAANRAETENYFCGVRGLTAETVAKFQLGFDTADRAAVIPYPGETYCVRRFTAIEPDAKGERKYDNPGGDKLVFNVPALEQDRCPVFVLEGQIDALSIIDAGGQACTGQNEQSAFVELAEKSPAPGFIIVSDQDKHGAAVTESLKAALQRKGLTVETAVMPPEIHDVNAFLRKRGREALAHWIHQRELTITPEIITIRELQEKIEAEGETDPNELIKRRFICKGAAGILAAETGCGKSSFIMQIALHWGAGLACFGLEPTRPLKTLLIQAENDERDLMEEISGVCRGASNVELLSAPQIEAAKEAVKIITDSTHSGDGFIAMLDRALKREQGTDVVIIDPLFSFAGCDLNDQERVSRFLRNQINPLLQTYHVAAIFVHHMAKPSRTAPPNANFNTAYNYHGSGEIINWARFALILERFEDKDGGRFYKLTPAKRGKKRLDWDVKYPRWSDSYIYWEELQNAPEMEHPVAKEDRAKQREEEKQRRLIEDAKRTAEILQPGESMTATELRNAIAGRLLITSKDRIEAILSVCVDRGFLVKRDPTKEEKTKPGIRAIYERPAEPPTQPEIF
ncbi:MAG: AAA family ATPase [Lentisphaeria bacterium]|nr:AAA family ATPase [Lentisphaeria bacterium]